MLVIDTASLVQTWYIPEKCMKLFAHTRYRHISTILSFDPMLMSDTKKNLAELEVSYLILLSESDFRKQIYKGNRCTGSFTSLVLLG